MPGQIAHYQVLAELGRGGMGVVYKVRNQRTQQLAALKMIPPEALTKPESALRFKREFRAMQRVEHPNVIRVFEAGTHDACPYFTMELVDGREIRAWLDGDEPIVPFSKDAPPSGTLTIEQRRRLNEPTRVKRLADAIVQVAYALSEIHSHRIVHRDLKPDNVLVSRAGVVKLMDFGIAKQMTGAGENSSGGMVVGTFKYLSPEQALGAEVDGRADLYCLGIIMYELLAGRHPFYSENSVGYAYHHAKKLPPDIARFNPEVHNGLKGICERLIKKDPRERYSTADDVIAAIKDTMEGFVEEMSQRLRPPPRGKELPYALAHDQLFHPVLVGRGPSLQALIATCDALVAGSGGITAITGPRGIGKTRLFREAAALAKAKNVEFVVGTCTQRAQAPYQPFVDILTQLVDELSDEDLDEQRRLLGDDGRVLARYVNALDRLDTRVRPRAARALDPEGERVRFMSAVTAFLGRCAAVKPRVLVFDDVEYADELSLRLLRQLAETIARPEAAAESPAQRSSPIALVLALDPGAREGAEARALLARLAKEKGFRREIPEALSPEEVREMLASMIGGGDVAQALADYLHHETNGIPGPVEERIRAWHEAGELRRSGRQWVLMKQTGQRPAFLAGSSQAPSASGQPTDEVVAPKDAVDLQRVTRGDIPVHPDEESPSVRRINKLSAVARDVAERIAIAGGRVAATLLERIALRPEDELLDALDELVKRELVVEVAGESYSRIPDADDVAALVRGLATERRQHLHLLVARALEEEGRRTRRPPNAEELAIHYAEGGEPLLAIDQHMAAARQALQASATQTAANRVREAQLLLADQLQHAPLDPRTIRADVELVLLRLDVLAAVNEHKDCTALAQRRLPKLRSAVDGRLVSEVLLRLAASELVLGDLDGALAHVGEVLSTTERGGAHALRCRAKSLCGLIYEHRGQFDLSERYYLDALELARAIGDEIEEERARAAIANRRLLAGDLAAAREAFERLLSAAEGRGEKLRIIGYVNSLGVIAHEEGRFEDAEFSYRRVAELAKPAGDRRSVAKAQTNIAVLRRDMGRFDDALSLCAKAARILLDLNQFDSVAYIAIVEAQTLLDRGQGNDNAVALEKAEEAFNYAERAGSALKLAEASICRGHALVRLGRTADATADISRGLEAARTLNANRVLLFGLLADLERAAGAGDAVTARARYREGETRATATGFLRFRTRFDAALKRAHLDKNGA